MPRSSSTVSKNATDESRRPSNRTLKYKKSSRKCNSNTKSQDRLVGGADIPEEVEDEASVTQETKEEPPPPPVPPPVEFEETPLQRENETPKHDTPPISSGGPCCVCLSRLAECPKDKKVDDMIDYVHQNLQEAGKALATLSENFEHDLKLMFADILGRIQQWTGIVQNKLDICKNDIEALRCELAKRACEIADLMKKLADCEDRDKQMAGTQTLAAESHLKEDGVQGDEGLSGEDGAQKTFEDSKNGTDEMIEDDNKGKSEVLEIVCTDAAIQSMMKDKERMRREIELEAEIARLRKENERIVKERAEYENAIQRALLRGVSSLNVEALRVLRCPPIPCCTPCAPCPTTTEPIPACKREATPKGCITQRNANGKTNARESGCTTVRRPCASPCCSGGKSRKSPSNNSMVFLLHQGDAGNVCGSNDAPMPRVCGTPVMKKLEIPPCPRFTR